MVWEPVPLNTGAEANEIKYQIPQQVR